MRANKARPAVPITWPAEVVALATPAGISLPNLLMPPKGPEAELTTLQTQSARAVDVSLDADRLAVAAVVVASNLPTTEPAPWTHDTFMSCVNDLKRDSVPGYPYSTYALEIADVIDNPITLAALEQVVFERLRVLSLVPSKALQATLAHDSAHALRLGYADPLRVILKADPTDAKKIEEKRWRFLLVLSLADQLVERVLFSRQNKAEIAQWQDITSKPGQGLEDEDAAALQRFVADHKLNLGSDASGWDQTVSLQMLLAEAERRVLCSPLAPPAWKQAVRNVFALSAHKNIMLSDGRIYRRNVPGAMASGRYVTSSSNSAIRAMLDVYVEAANDPNKATMAMGDDAVSRVDIPADEYERRCAAVGVKLTDLAPATPDDFEFCSHRFRNGHPVHLRPMKTVGLVIATGAGPLPTVISRRASLMQAWRHVPQAAVYLAMIDAVSQ